MILSKTIKGSFDQLNGNIASGWAADQEQPNVPVKIEFYAGDQHIGSTTANNFRADVRDAGFGDGYAGFTTSLKLPAGANSKTTIHACIGSKNIELMNSPRYLNISPYIIKWLNRSSRLNTASLARLKRFYNKNQKHKKISIVIPFYNTSINWLREAICSVQAQWCDNWELICVDDASTDFRVGAILKGFVAQDNRIKYLRLQSNGGTAAAMNAGIHFASGDYVAFMDHDDYIEPDAVYKFLSASESGADLIYCDEIITDDNINSIISVAARPAFSHDYYLSHPYFVHMIAVKRALAINIGGWNERLKISSDVDFVLRIVEQSSLIAHIPSVLYRWRTHNTSVGHQNRGDVMAATRAVISSHLIRIRSPAKVSYGPTFNSFRIDYPDDKERVLIIIPTKNRFDILKNCIESIERTTNFFDVKICIIDHQSDDYETVKYLQSIRHRHFVLPYYGGFNYSAMNNFAVKQQLELFKYILFMNNDVQAINNGWLERMRSLSARNDVGVVGATLLYGDGRIQHSGVIIGMQGTADHAHKFKSFSTGAVRNAGYLCSLVSLREYCAVTAACMMIKLNDFNAVGGFDENLSVGFNDTDLCLRLFSKGLKILNDPYVVLFHHESTTRKHSNHIEHPKDNNKFSKRWKKIIEEGDYFYNPLLSLSGNDYEININNERIKNIGVSRLVKITCGLAQSSE